MRATLTLVRSFGPAAVVSPAVSPGPVVLTLARRENPMADRTLLRVAIDPPPAVIPAITYTIAGDPGITLSATEPNFGGGRSAPPGQTYVYAPRAGHAVVTARVGPPYDATVSTDVLAYGSVQLGCSSPGYAIALGVDADGALRRVNRPADADAYLALPPAAATGFCQGATAYVDDRLAAPVIRFPMGAIHVDAPASAFSTVSARAWRPQTTEVPERDASGIWLIRSHSGATIKLIRFGPFAVAPAGGEFTDIGYAGTRTAVVTVRAYKTAPRFSAAVTGVREMSLFMPLGAPSRRLIVGVAPLGRYTASLFGAGAVATLQPAPYGAPAPDWSVEGPIVAAPRGDGGVAVTGTHPGIGRLTASFPMFEQTKASIEVAVYPVVAIGCSDISNGYGVAFSDDGAANVVDTPAEADLYASYDAHAFVCRGLVSAPAGTARPPTPFTPGPPSQPGADAAAGWYFPYGGVFFPNGDDPHRTPPAGSPRGAPFDAVTTAMWRNDRTSELLDRYRADTSPCTETRGNIAYPIAGCTAMPDRILLIRTKRGRFVKLLWMGRAPGSFVGLYAVSRADGTFAY